MYFGNYTKIVYLAQTRDEDLAKKAMAAARKLGLAMNTASPAMASLRRT